MRGGSAERVGPTMSMDGLSAYVPAIRAGVRALRHDAERAYASFRPTDLEQLNRDAETLDRLAHKLDVRDSWPT